MSGNIEQKAKAELFQQARQEGSVETLLIESSLGPKMLLQFSPYISHLSVCSNRFSWDFPDPIGVQKGGGGTTVLRLPPLLGHFVKDFTKIVYFIFYFN